MGQPRRWRRTQHFPSPGEAASQPEHGDADRTGSAKGDAVPLPLLAGPPPVRLVGEARIHPLQRHGRSHISQGHPTSNTLRHHPSLTNSTQHNGSLAASQSGAASPTRLDENHDSWLNDVDFIWVFFSQYQGAGPRLKQDSARLGPLLGNRVTTMDGRIFIGTT